MGRIRRVRPGNICFAVAIAPNRRKAYAVVVACSPSLLLTLGSVAPTALWLAFSGVGEGDHLAFGALGFVVTAVTWFALLLATGHPD